MVWGHLIDAQWEQIPSHLPTAKSRPKEGRLPALLVPD